MSLGWGMRILGNNLRSIGIILVLGLLIPTFFSSVFAELEIDSEIQTALVTVPPTLPDIYTESVIDSRIQASLEATAQSFEKFFEPTGNALELIFGLSSPYLILLLFPIGAYILCRSDAEDTEYWQIQKIISLGVIILLVSSIFIFPFPVGSDGGSSAEAIN